MMSAQNIYLFYFNFAFWGSTTLSPTPASYTDVCGEIIIVL